MDKQEYDVFISYSRGDYVDKNQNVIPGNVVSKVKDRLAAEGIRYWFDEEGIYSGQNFVDKIITNIEASKIFVFLSSENSNKSKYTCREIASADELGKHIIPVRIDATPYNKKVLFRIADLDYIEFYTNPEKGLNDLVNSIKAYLAQLQEEQDREEQQRLVADLRLQCKALNNEEAKVELDREKLLLKAEKVKDNELREALKTEIANSGPIRVKCLKENETLKAINAKQEDEIGRLEMLIRNLQSEYDQLKGQIEESRKKRLGIDKRATTKNVCLACCAILVLIVFCLVSAYTDFWQDVQNCIWEWIYL